MNNEHFIRENKGNYIKSGYEIFNFKNNKELLKIKKLILNKLIKFTGNNKINLSNYNKYITEDNQHLEIQAYLSKEIWKSNLIVNFCLSIKNEIQKYVGNDFSIQKNPFLRIARPGNINDNIGFHKDTFYGQKLSEISLHIPLVNLNNHNCLKIIKNSHKKNNYKIKKNKSKHSKGSLKHELGFPYEPQNLNINESRFYPIKMKFGEGLFFTPALIHGQKINRSKVTRFSFDIRIANSLKLDWKNKKIINFYYKISYSKNEELISIISSIYN